MPRSSPSYQYGLPFARWPAADKAAWDAGCTPGDPFDDPRYGAGLRAGSLRKVIGGYGRWLGFLEEQGLLDDAQPPLVRVTRERLRLYFQVLRAAGNAGWTIIGRFQELATAMRVMVPGADVGWIRRPDGVTIYNLVDRRRRPMLTPESTTLFTWAIGMMDKARAGSAAMEVEGLVAFRDGLLLAMLAARGRRLRAMAALRIGIELLRDGDDYRIVLAPELVKTGKPDRFALPVALSSYITHYLMTVRPLLLGHHRHDALWVTRHGQPMSAAVVANRVFRRTRREFGTAFGPHRFRHSIATTAALKLPEHPGLAAGVLGISGSVVEKHYNMAGQAEAASNYAKLVERRERAVREDRLPRRHRAA